MKPRRVLSIISGPASADALELSAHALAEDVELTVLLVGAAVELAVVGEGPAAGADRDLQALRASGVVVLVARDDLEARGLADAPLAEGVVAVEDDALATHLADAEVVLTLCGRPGGDR